MDQINKICFSIVLIIFIFALGYLKGSKDCEKDINNVIENTDTSYNRIVLDSIQWNIIKKDSIIYELKIKYDYEIEEAINADDSTVVKQFNQLASGE